MFIQSYDDSNFVSNLFTQTEDKVISNTAVETTLIGSGVGSLIFPINFFHEGRSIQGNALGKISAINGASSTIKIFLGDTVLIESTSTFPATFEDVLFNAEFTFTYSDGYIYGRGMTTILAAQGFGAITSRQLVMSAPVAVDPSGAFEFDVTYKWDAASTTRVLTSTNLLLNSIK